MCHVISPAWGDGETGSLALRPQRSAAAVIFVSLVALTRRSAGQLTGHFTASSQTAAGLLTQVAVSLVTRWAARRYGGMATFYEKMTEPMERAGLAAIRARLAGDLHGRILEIGCGTGLNFVHYSAAAEVVAIEPLDEFREAAAQRARDAAARITVQDGDAHCLDFPDASFDAALQTLVFCSVADAHQGLLELRRVLRPGAPVRFIEHVRSPRAAAALVQDLANPIWRWLSDGCNLNRDTVADIARCGFAIDEVHVRDLPGTAFFPMREVHAHS